MDNKTRYIALLGTTPSAARKTIAAGKLKGMTDINPMFRITRMTEVFGPQGEGWYFDNINYTISEGAGEAAVICTLSLRVKLADGSWSEPIHGVGGSKLYGKGVGDGINDEAYKMAFTDAQSIAMKGLGMCKDIYYEKDRTKYDAASDVQTTTTSKAASKPAVSPAANSDEDEAISDAYNCVDIETLSKIYNEKWGGNKAAPGPVKKIFSNRFNELKNEEGMSNAKTA